MMLCVCTSHLLDLGLQATLIMACMSEIASKVYASIAIWLDNRKYGVKLVIHKQNLLGLVLCL